MLWRSLFLRLLFVFFQLKDQKGKDGAEKPPLSPKGLKTQKKMKPPDTTGVQYRKLDICFMTF